MSVKPKFEIGDHVVFKGTTGRKKRLRDYLGGFRKDKDGKDVLIDIPAQVFRVTDHRVETCYGGTQVHYVMRALAIGSDGIGFEHAAAVTAENKLFNAREVELEAAPEVP